MNIGEANKIVQRIKYRSSYQFSVNETGLIIHRIDADTNTGIIDLRNLTIPLPELGTEGFGLSELVHRVFAVLLQFEQHECCEWFKFDDVAIFHPHTDVSRLVEALHSR
jgi:hypothetical protein